MSNSEKQTVVYSRTQTELPYPRVEYKCECGFLNVKFDGFLLDEFNRPTAELNTPKGKCMKCKKEIIFSNTGV